VVVCSLLEDKKNINKLRSKLLNVYENEMRSIKIDDVDFKRYIPLITDD